MKKIMAIGLMMIILFITSGCEQSHTVEQYEKHGNINYLEYEEIYNKYRYIKEVLKHKDELTQSDIVKLCNTYKKIYSSVDYIDYQNNDQSWSVMDILPEMDGLFDDMEDQIVKLVIDNKVLQTPEKSERFQEELIISYYLRSTEYFDVSDVVIVRGVDNVSNYYVLSKKGHLFFNINISTDKDGSILIDPTIENIVNTEQMATNGIPLDDCKNKIPSVSVFFKEETGG